MKKPNENVKSYAEYPLSVEDTETGKWFTQLKSDEHSTILRSVFEEDSAKIARAFAMNKRQMKDFTEKLKEEFSENKYFIIEDLKTEKMIGFLKIESQDKASVIIRYPAIAKTKNDKFSTALKDNFRKRVVETINDFAIKVKINFRATEYRVN